VPQTDWNIQRQQRRKVVRHIADRLFGEDVVDRIHRAIGDEVDAQQSAIAGIAQLVVPAGNKLADVSKRLEILFPDSK